MGSVETSWEGFWELPGELQVKHISSPVFVFLLSSFAISPPKSPATKTTFSVKLKTSVFSKKLVPNPNPNLEKKSQQIGEFQLKKPTNLKKRGKHNNKKTPSRHGKLYASSSYKFIEPQIFLGEIHHISSKIV